MVRCDHVALRPGVVRLVTLGFFGMAQSLDNPAATQNPCRVRTIGVKHAGLTCGNAMFAITQHNANHVTFNI